jgi:hypothetical protein
MSDEFDNGLYSNYKKYYLKQNKLKKKNIIQELSPTCLTCSYSSALAKRARPPGYSLPHLG